MTGREPEIVRSDSSRRVRTVRSATCEWAVTVHAGVAGHRLGHCSQRARKGPSCGRFPAVRSRSPAGRKPRGPNTRRDRPSRTLREGAILKCVPGGSCAQQRGRLPALGMARRARVTIRAALAFLSNAARSEVRRHLARGTEHRARSTTGGNRVRQAVVRASFDASRQRQGSPRASTGICPSGRTS